MCHGIVTLVFAGVFACAPHAAAQTDRTTPQLPRADVSGSLGVSGTNEQGDTLHDNWYWTWHGTVSGGYYWTEHLKTEIDARVTSEGQLWGSRVAPGGTYASVAYRFSTRSMALAQQYQFGHNARVHPYVTAGVRFEWVKYTEERGPVYVSIRTPPYSVLLEPERTIGPVTELEVVPFIGGGFKAYFNERAFFRTDMGIGLRGGVKHVTFSSGLGVDF